MRLLDRYVIRNFLYAALLWFLVMMSLRIIVDMFVGMDEFVKKEKPFWTLAYEIFTYYRYNSLVYLTELGGLIIVAAAAFSIAMMNRSNELTAMMASGVSLHRVAVPIIVCSLLLGGVIVVDQELLIPQVVDKLARKKDNVSGSKNFPVYLASDSAGSVLYSPEFSAVDKKLREPVILPRHKEYQAAGMITASQGLPGELDGKTGWFLDNARIARVPWTGKPWAKNPDYTRVYTALSPESLLATFQVSQSQPVNTDDANILRLKLDRGISEPDNGLALKGLLELDPPIAGQPRGGKLINARFTFTTDDSEGKNPESEVPLGTFIADAATYVPANDHDHGMGYWELTGGRLFFPTDIDVEDLIVRQSSSYVEYLSSSQLTDLLQKKRIADPRMVQMTQATRFTDPLNNVIMLLLALPFILSRERNIKASTGLCLLMVGAFYSFIYICRYMGLPPDWSAFVPTILFGSISVIMLDSVKT
jgi:lipopolysaccharide export LptBFGC system permease protein LptF